METKRIRRSGAPRFRSDLARRCNLQDDRHAKGVARDWLGPVQRLFSQEDVSKFINTKTKGFWGRLAYQSFVSIITNEGFPCFYAGSAYAKGHLCYAFGDTINNPAEWANLRQALEGYVARVTAMPALEAMMSPIVMFLKPGDNFTVDHYVHHAWNFIQYLHDHDPEPWPAGVPTDPQNMDWSFCFGGIQLFVNVSTPAHSTRKSRNLGTALVLVIQPRDGFDTIRGKVRGHIRQRIQAFDGIPASRYLGTYGKGDSLEWEQYHLPDNDSPTLGKCPFHGKTEVSL